MQAAIASILKMPNNGEFNKSATFACTSVTVGRTFVKVNQTHKKWFLFPYEKWIEGNEVPKAFNVISVEWNREHARACSWTATSRKTANTIWQMCYLASRLNCQRSQIFSVYLLKLYLFWFQRNPAEACSLGCYRPVRIHPHRQPFSQFRLADQYLYF